MTMQITVCGGGNAAHALTGLLSSRKEFSVHVFAPFGDEAKRWQDGVAQAGGITVVTTNGRVVGRPSSIGSDPSAAVAGSQLILLALPAFAHESILRQIAEHISPDAWVGALPARGGFDLCARDILSRRSKELAIFGLQTLPWACRIQQYGQQVKILGYKEQVDLAAWPPALAGLISSILQAPLGVKLNPIASFLSLTLADTGQLIHPGIMYGLFHDWTGEAYERPSLFYQSVDGSMAEALQQMSDEVQAVRHALQAHCPELDLSAVRPLGEWLQRSYRADIVDSSTLQSSFTSNRSYAGLLAPMQVRDDGSIPDFQGRYLSEDVPFGLVVTRGIADLAGIATPIVDKVLTWAQQRLDWEYLVDGKLQGADIVNTRSPQRYGFASLDQFMLEMRYLTQTGEAAAVCQ